MIKAVKLIVQLVLCMLNTLLAPINFHLTRHLSTVLFYVQASGHYEASYDLARYANVSVYPRYLQPTAAWYEYFWCCCTMYGSYVIVDHFNSGASYIQRRVKYKKNLAKIKTRKL